MNYPNDGPYRLTDSHQAFYEPDSGMVFPEFISECPIQFRDEAIADERCERITFDVIRNYSRRRRSVAVNPTTKKHYVNLEFRNMDRYGAGL